MAYAKRRAVPHPGLGHVEIALLEDLQRQQPARIQDGIERKDRECQTSQASGPRADGIDLGVTRGTIPPARHQVVLDAELVENARDHEVDEILHGRGMIEPGIGRQG